MRTVVATILLLVLAGDSRSQDQVPFSISVNVDLVVLQATVRNQKGDGVSNLREQDFNVYEDGVRQTIKLFRHEDVPVTVGLVIDHSGSMRRKLPEVAAAARTFVGASSPDDQMFVVNFNEKVTLGLPDAVRLTNRADELAKAVFRTPAQGMTALYDAMVQALDRLQTGTHDKKVLLVVSDGGDNASTVGLNDVLRKAAQSTALIYTIGIFDADVPDRNPDVLRRLARATGGEAYFPRHTEEVVAVCERIAKDIRHQYTLGYVSGNTVKPGTYRSLRVNAKMAAQGKLIVRARAGYIAGGPGTTAVGGAFHK